MRKHLKHLLVFLLVVSMTIPIAEPLMPAQTVQAKVKKKTQPRSQYGKAKSSSKAGNSNGSNFPGSFTTNYEADWNESVAQYVYHNKKKFKTTHFVGDGIIKKKRPATPIIVKQRIAKGSKKYRFFLCTLITNKLVDKAGDNEPKQERHNFASESGHWETCEYAITPGKLKGSTDVKTYRDQTFFFRLTHDGDGKYSPSKRTGAVGLVYTNDGQVSCEGGHCQIWKDAPGHKGKEYIGVVLHYHLLSDPKRPGQGLLHYIMEKGYKIHQVSAKGKSKAELKKEVRKYPFGYAVVYLHAIPAQKSKPASDAKPRYNLNYASKVARKGEISKNWNIKLKVPVYPKVRIRAVDLATNKIIRPTTSNFYRYCKGKNKSGFNKVGSKYYYKDYKFEISKGGQLIYDVFYWATNDTEKVDMHWGGTPNIDKIRTTTISAEKQHKYIRNLALFYKQYINSKLYDKDKNEKFKEAINPTYAKKRFYIVGADACVSNLHDYKLSSSNYLGSSLDIESIPDNIGAVRVKGTKSVAENHCLSEDSISHRYGSWCYMYALDYFSPASNTTKNPKWTGEWDCSGQKYSLNADTENLPYKKGTNLNTLASIGDKNVNFLIKHIGMKNWDSQNSYLKFWEDGTVGKKPYFTVTFYYLPSLKDEPERKNAQNCWYVGDNVSITDKNLSTLPHTDIEKLKKSEKPVLTQESSNGGKFKSKNALQLQSIEGKKEYSVSNLAKIPDEHYDQNGIIYSLQGYLSRTKDKSGKLKDNHQSKHKDDLPWFKEPGTVSGWMDTLKNDWSSRLTQDLFYTIKPPVVAVIYTKHYSKDGTYTWKKEYECRTPKFYLNGNKVKLSELQFADVSKYTTTKLLVHKKNGVETSRELVSQQASFNNATIGYIPMWKVSGYDYDCEDPDEYVPVESEDDEIGDYSADEGEEDTDDNSTEEEPDEYIVEEGAEDEEIEEEVPDTESNYYDNSDDVDTPSNIDEDYNDEDDDDGNDGDPDADVSGDEDEDTDDSGSPSAPVNTVDPLGMIAPTDVAEVDELLHKCKKVTGTTIKDGYFNMPKSSTLVAIFFGEDLDEDNTYDYPQPFESTEPQPITPVYNDPLHPLQEKTYTDNDPGFPGPNLSDNPTVIHSGHNDFNGSRQTKTDVTYFDLSKLEKYGTANKSYYHNHQGKPWTYMDERWDYNDGQPWIYSKTSDVALPLVGMERNAKISIKTDEKRSSKDKNGNTFDAEKNIATSEYLKTYGELNKYEVNIEIKKIKTTYRYSGTFTYVRWECHQHTKTCTAECGQILDCHDSGVCPACPGHVVVTKNGSYTWYHHHPGGCHCNWKKYIYTVSGEQKRDTIYYELADGAAYYPSDYTVWNDVLGDPGQQTVFERDKGGQGEPISWKQNLGFSYTKGHSWEPSNHAVWWVSPSAGGGNPGCSGGGKTQDDDRNCVVPYLADRWKCFWCNRCKKDPLYTKAEADARINQAIANDEAAQNGKIIFNDGEGHTQSLANQTTYKYCYVPGWLKKLSDPCDKKYLIKDGIKIPKDRYNGLHNSNYYATKYSLGNKADIYWGDNDAAHGGVDYYDPAATVHYTLSPRGHQGVAVSSPKQEKFFHNDYAYAVPVNDVRVHTPTVCNAWIISDQSQVQTLDYKPGLPLDRWFYVHIDATGDNIDDPGYGEQDYSRYLNDGVVNGQICKVGYVKFDFAVLRQDSGKWSYYNPNVWIPCRLGDTLFYLPTTDHMVDSATVTYQTRAENSWITDAYDLSVATGVTSTDRNTQIFYKKRVSRVEDVANLQNDNYVSTTTEDWALTGRIYNFKIDDITDYPVWKKEFRDSEGKLRWNSLHSGLYDRDDFQRYSDPLQTLVPVTGTNDEHPNQTALNTGYAFRYSFETVGDFEDKNDSITIVPKFSWVDKDGKNRTDVSVYYNDKIGDSYKHLVKVGSSLDKTNRKPFSISQYGIGQDTLDSTAKANGYTETEKFTSIKSELFCPSTIHLPWTLHTYDGWYHKSNLVGGERADFDVSASKADFGLNAPQETFTSLKEAVAQFGEQGKVYASEGSVVTRNDIYTSVQNWYGEYYLPSDIYVTDATDAQVKAATSDEFTGKESIWRQDGYLVVNFEIIANDGGKPYIGYDNTYKNYGNAYGEEFGLHYGKGLDTTDYGTVPYDLVTLGTILVGRQAVEEGLINEVGGIHEALSRLHTMIEE